MWQFSDIVKSEHGRLNLSMTFTHSKGGGTWIIKYRLGKQNGKSVNKFKILAPDTFALRNYHKLDTVMLVVKNCAFHDRYNTTGNVSFVTFKHRLREVIGVDEANRIAQMFVDRIKSELSTKV